MSAVYRKGGDFNLKFEITTHRQGTKMNSFLRIVAERETGSFQKRCFNHGDTKDTEISLRISVNLRALRVPVAKICPPLPGRQLSLLLFMISHRYNMNISRYLAGGTGQGSEYCSVVSVSHPK